MSNLIWVVVGILLLISVFFIAQDKYRLNSIINRVAALLEQQNTAYQLKNNKLTGQYTNTIFEVSYNSSWRYRHIKVVLNLKNEQKLQGRLIWNSHYSKILFNHENFDIHTSKHFPNHQFLTAPGAPTNESELESLTHKLPKGLDEYSIELTPQSIAFYFYNIKSKNLAQNIFDLIKLKH